MTAYEIIAARLAPFGLRIAGGFHTNGEEIGPGGPPTASVLLVAPDERHFWPIFAASPEMADDKPDPLDRYSRRVLTHIAAELGPAFAVGVAFPFDDPPPPFITWALRSGRVHASPVGLLVDEVAGLWFSMRGAFLLHEVVELPLPCPSPCASCTAQPCKDACPVGALSPAGHDVSRCHAFLDTAEGKDCLAAGCRVRAACPFSQASGRPAAQASFHMRAFHTPQRR